MGDCSCCCCIVMIFIGSQMLSKVLLPSVRTTDLDFEPMEVRTSLKNFLNCDRWLWRSSNYYDTNNVFQRKEWLTFTLFSMWLLVIQWIMVLLGSTGTERLETADGSTALMFLLLQKKKSLDCVLTFVLKLRPVLEFLLNQDESTFCSHWITLKDSRSCLDKQGPN